MLSFTRAPDSRLFDFLLLFTHSRGIRSGICGSARARRAGPPASPRPSSQAPTAYWPVPTRVPRSRITEMLMGVLVSDTKRMASQSGARARSPAQPSADARRVGSFDVRAKRSPKRSRFTRLFRRSNCRPTASQIEWRRCFEQRNVTVKTLNKPRKETSKRCVPRVLPPTIVSSFDR